MNISKQTQFRILKISRIILLIAMFYFLLNTYQWMTFEKYQLDGGIKGISVNIDKELGLDKMTETAINYEQLWIHAEKKFNFTLAIISGIIFICLTVYKRKFRN